AGAVAKPLRRMSAGMDSTISISRSVAVSLSALLPASSITLERMGMVLRRSTTLCTWERALRNAPRSTLIFIGPNFRPQGEGVLFAKGPVFGPRFCPARNARKTPIFLCFGAGAGRPKAAPRLKWETIAKGGQKGKKNAGKTGVFLPGKRAFLRPFGPV